MANCFDDVTHESIDHCPNHEIAAGITTRLYYVPSSFIQKMTLPDNEGTYETRVGITEENLVLKSGKSWKGIDIVVDENALKTQLVGNRGLKKQRVELEFLIPGVTEKGLGFMSVYKNCPIVCVVKDNNNKLFVVGTVDNPAFIDSAEGDSGKKFEDNSAISVKVVANCKLYTYKGQITEHE